MIYSSTKLSPVRRSKRIILLGILFFFSFLLRLMYLNQVKNNPFFEAPFIDSYAYDTRAITLSEGAWFGKGIRNMSYQAPLYTYFLSSIYRIFGHNYYIVRLIQIFIGSLNCLFIYFIAKKIFNRKIGIISFLTASVYGTFIFFDGELLRPCLVIFLNLLLILLLLQAKEKPSYRKWFITGIVLGMSAITRENILLFVPFILFWIYMTFHKLKPKKEIILYTVIFCIGIIFIILPITIRNYLLEKDFILISPQGGVNFYIGNTADVDRLTLLQPGPQWDELIKMPEKRKGQKLKSSQRSNWFFIETFNFIIDNPIKWLKIMIKKFSLFWNSFEFMPNHSIDFIRSYSPLLKVLLGNFYGVFYPFGLIAPLAIAGIVISLRYWQKMILLYFYTFAYMVSVVVFHVRSRYRIPVVPILIMFAVYTMYYIFEQVRKKKGKNIIRVSFLFLVFVFLVNFDFYSINKVNTFALHYHLAQAYSKKGQLALAFKEYQKAVEVNPNDADSHNNLGTIYYGQKKYARAIREYQKVLEINPNHAKAHFNLAGLYKEQKEYAKAIQEYQKAQENDPSCIDYYYNLGVLYCEQKEYAKAIKKFQKILEINPNYIRAHNNLGTLYYSQKEYKKALQEFESILELNPYDENVKAKIRIIKELLNKH